MLLQSMVVSWRGFEVGRQTHFLKFGVGRLISGVLICSAVRICEVKESEWQYPDAV